ncbi:MAG: hypothetical protein L6Q54_13460 [Leptospiraceae bacterium]|nr:hypothetical protein [Leptospiraceae bacterium]MCK6382241.1 hypothetical protein [Leptospiraceae bacterium]NUM40587.1 hypothetical protein [Leptospiraceae bacterium]
MLESFDTESALTIDEKIYVLDEFIKEHPQSGIQDLYRWLYSGEFGQIDLSGILKGESNIPQLQKILDDIKSEAISEDLIKRVWDPVGFSMRFVTVYVTEYYNRECPLKRLVNLIERAPAFQGSRMQFKLDWSFLKDYLTKTVKKFDKQDFYNFEDKIGFYQLPEINFSDVYLSNYPTKYRVVPRKLFLGYFPEFDDKHDLKVSKSKSLLGEM